MDIDIIENILKNNTDRSRYVGGIAAYKSNLVKNSYSNKNGDVLTLYATVYNEIHSQRHTSLITINEKTHRIIEGSCDCNDWLSKSSQGKVFLCKHMVATMFKCLTNLNNKPIKKVISNTQNSQVNNLNINILKNQVITGHISEGLGNNFSFSFSIGNIDKKEYKKIFNTYKENKRLYKLEGSNYLDLHEEDIKSLLELLDILGFSDNIDNIKIPSSKCLYIDNLINSNHITYISGRENLSKISNRFKSNIAYKIPKDLNATLRDYQVEGLKWFNSLSYYEFGGILADEMGLGKTIQTITFLMANKNKKSIIITPTSLIHNWKYEFDKFAPSMKIGLIHGDKKQREIIMSKYKEYDVILTTYGTLKNDLEKYTTKVFDYCIIDEAQNIKNPQALNTKAVKLINAKVKFALTGTPIENNLLELWSIFDFVMPGFLYDKNKFQNTFINNNNNVKELKNLIKPFMLRRTKKEVMKELPDKIEKKFFVELNNEQQKIYNIYNKSVLDKIKNSKQDKITIFSYLTKLRQLCLDPSVLLKSYTGSSTKIDITLDLIKDAIEDKRKILIFSQFTTMLKNIGNKLNENDIEYSYLDGKTKPEDRIKLVERFNKSEDKKVFLISLKAGGTGLNLTSADMVIHFDPWWNPAVENQASDRAHRYGQKNVVEVIKLVSKNTIEEKIIQLQEHKKELIDNIIDGNLNTISNINSLSEEELINLFKY